MLTNPRDALRGQLSSPNMVSFDMLGLVSYYCLIVETLSVRLTVFKIFDYKNVITLKSGSEVTQSQSMWYHSIDWVWFPISVL